MKSKIFKYLNVFAWVIALVIIGNYAVKDLRNGSAYERWYEGSMKAIKIGMTREEVFKEMRNHGYREVEENPEYHSIDFSGPYSLGIFGWLNSRYGEFLLVINFDKDGKVINLSKR